MMFVLLLSDLTPVPAVKSKGSEAGAGRCRVPGVGELLLLLLIPPTPPVHFLSDSPALNPLQTSATATKDLVFSVNRGDLHPKVLV